MSTIKVDTTAGKIAGTMERHVYTFKGVPYGASTAGRRRFLPPLPVKPWSGVRYCTDYGPIAPQSGALVNCNEAAEDERIMGIRRHLPQSEDCLVLSIWTPGVGDGAKHPVMVWLHGRGFASGAGSEFGYNGSELAKRGDLVVVTVNHRLNVFGYLHLADIAGESYAGSGVAGMLDVVLALQWVHDNIQAFGGDPGNVTIFGESGGGAKVSTMLGLPSAKGLFHRAIIQSGPGLRGVDRKDATDLAERLMAKLEIKANEIEKLQDLPTKQVLDAVNSLVPVRGMVGMMGVPPGAIMRLSPVVDGKYYPNHPFDPVAAPTAAGISLIIGTNRDESALFMAGDPRRNSLTEPELRERLAAICGDKVDQVLGVYRKTRPGFTPWRLLTGISSEGARRASIALAERKAAASTAPAYMYLFTWETDYLGDVFQACHALEIAFVFDHVDDMPITGGRPDRYELAAAMSTAWAAFARTGNPNHPGIPKWQPYSAANRATMLFDVPCRAVVDPFREELDAWEGIPLRR